MEMITIKLSDIQKIAETIKEYRYHQVYLKIGLDGTIQGSWFVGRSDFVENNNLIVLLDCSMQSKGMLVSSILNVLRSREGYSIEEEHSDH